MPASTGWYRFSKPVGDKILVTNTSNSPVTNKAAIVDLTAGDQIAAVVTLPEGRVLSISSPIDGKVLLGVRKVDTGGATEQIFIVDVTLGEQPAVAINLPTAGLWFVLAGPVNNKFFVYNNIPSGYDWFLVDITVEEFNLLWEDVPFQSIPIARREPKYGFKG
jgi:hypothetical protein